MVKYKIQRMYILVVVCFVFGSEWGETPVKRDGDYVETFSFSGSTTFSPTEVGSGGCVGCVLYDSGTFSSSSPACDCGSKVISWKREAMSESEFLRLSGSSVESDDDDLSLSSRSPNGRCTAVSYGWSWDVSGDDTVPIVLTIPPGNKGTVWLSGTSLPSNLGTDGTSRGMPCGTIFQDVYEATPVSFYFNLIYFILLDFFLNFFLLTFIIVFLLILGT